MVDEAPAGALDPNSSNYLFHGESAAAKGTTTQGQNETMYNDPNQPQYSEGTRVTTDRDITGTTNQDLATDNVNTVTPGNNPSTTNY